MSNECVWNAVLRKRKVRLSSQQLEFCDYQSTKQVRDCRENLPGPIPLIPSFRQLNVPVS
jgi:hypothetical protein